MLVGGGCILNSRAPNLKLRIVSIEGTTERTARSKTLSGYRNLPAPSPDLGLSAYMAEIRKFPVLDPEEEFILAKRWAEENDSGAAHKLVTSHLRLAAKIAMGYRGYGLPVADVISEANLGLMQAVKRFDPDRGFRLATYAMWWIRASIQEFVLRSWSMVKLGTTASQKKLFFNLNRAKSRIGAMDSGSLKPEETRRIAEMLDVSEADVASMSMRLSGRDASLNAPATNDVENATERQDLLIDENADHAERFAEQQDHEVKRRLLLEATERLSDREKDVFLSRRLAETPKTLEELARKYDLSRERIRQIEVAAFKKVRSIVMQLASDKGIVG